MFNVQCFWHGKKILCSSKALFCKTVRYLLRTKNVIILNQFSLSRLFPWVEILLFVFLPLLKFVFKSTGKEKQLLSQTNLILIFRRKFIFHILTCERIRFLIEICHNGCENLERVSKRLFFYCKIFILFRWNW